MNIIKCKVCGNTHVDKEDNLYVCKKCGFHTSSVYINLNKDYQTKPKTVFDNYLLQMPKLVQDIVVYDEVNKCYWLPMILNVYPIGIIYPNGLNKDNWSWMFSKYIVIPLEERINYPNPQKQGEYFEYRLDVENEQLISNYEDGLKLLNV